MVKPCRSISRATVLARTTLDWLLLAAAVMQDQIEVQTHTSGEISAWSTDQAVTEEKTDAQIAVKAGRPLSPPPVKSIEAEAIIAELNLPYSHPEVANLAAAVSVTSLVKKGDANSGPAFLLKQLIGCCLDHPSARGDWLQPQPTKAPLPMQCSNILISPRRMKLRIRFHIWSIPGVSPARCRQRSISSRSDGFWKATSGS